MNNQGLAELLARRLAETGRGPSAPITVAELHRALLPYRACRDALGFASKAEYDLALLEFLRDGPMLERNDALARAVERELKVAEPGLAFLQEFAAATLEISDLPDVPVAEAAAGRAAKAVGSERGDQGRPAAMAEPATLEVGEALDDIDELFDAPPPAPRAPAAAPHAGAAATGGDYHCWSCFQTLPTDREVHFCPFCGSDQSVPRCDGCAEELERDWRFCPACGSPAEEG